MGNIKLLKRAILVAVVLIALQKTPLGAFTGRPIQ